MTMTIAPTSQMILFMSKRSARLVPGSSKRGKNGLFGRPQRIHIDSSTTIRVTRRVPVPGHAAPNEAHLRQIRRLMTALRDRRGDRGTRSSMGWRTREVSSSQRPSRSVRSRPLAVARPLRLRACALASSHEGDGDEGDEAGFFAGAKGGSAGRRSEPGTPVKTLWSAESSRSIAAAPLTQTARHFTYPKMLSTSCLRKRREPGERVRDACSVSPTAIGTVGRC